MLCWYAAPNLLGSTYAAARSASLGISIDTSAALGAAVVVGVDDDGGRLHFDSRWVCFVSWYDVKFGIRKVGD
jgi:hypothetical protein